MIVHKGKAHEFDTRDWNRPFATKYDSPLAMYLDRLPFDASDADEDDQSSTGDSAYRFGRRILWADDQGFVSVTVHDSVDVATSTMEQVAHDWHHCTDCGHMDFDAERAETCECACHFGW